MFLQFFVWGAWFVTAYPVLSRYGFGPNEIKWTFSAGPVAAILSPFLVGLLADRWLSSQYLLSVLHAFAGVSLLLAAYLVTQQEMSAGTVNTFIFIHTLFYMPTIALTAAITLRHVSNQSADFPRIRFFGGAGWIAAAMTISALGIDTNIKSFYLSVVASFVLALFAIVLPKTPPPQKISRAAQSAGVLTGAYTLFRDRNFSVFVFSTFLLFIPAAFYFQLGAKYMEVVGFERIAAVMSLGQIAELVFILTLPFLLKRYSIRTVILVGCSAWIVRYALFAGSFTYGLPTMALTAVLLHGICYDFCFVAGTINVDRMADSSNRSQAQSIFMMFTYGFGLLVGSQLAGFVEAQFTTISTSGMTLVDWQSIWIVPAGIALVALLTMLLFYRSNGTAAGDRDTEVRSGE